jgi:formylmethanofuran dehydrogenase subunit E
LLICGRSRENFLEEIRRFHGLVAPGLVIGGFMVDWALELLDDNSETDAIVETVHCLPDAIQIFTPCTYGNGWMKVLDWDKFALSLYTKRNLKGFRIWLDLEKAKSFPNIYNWYMRLTPKEKLPLDVLLQTIFDAQRSILSSCPINITAFYEKKKKGVIQVCPACGEAYPARQGDVCLACQGKGYYEPIPVHGNVTVDAPPRALAL